MSDPREDSDFDERLDRGDRQAELEHEVDGEDGWDDYGDN